MQLKTFPRSLSVKAIVSYIITQVAILLAFPKASMPFYLYVFGISAVVLFFSGSHSMSRQWQIYGPKRFEMRLFWTAFSIRLVVAIGLYFLNYALYGNNDASDGGDIGWYIDMADYGYDYIVYGIGGSGPLLSQWFGWGVAKDDVGYPLYLTIVRLLSFGQSPYIVPLILKCVWGALSCVFMARIGERHFGSSAGRLAGIFCALQFNMIWWCACMMKETEMVFMTILFIDISDRFVRHRSINAKQIVALAALLMATYTFRKALAVVEAVALGAALVISSKKIVAGWKRVLAFFLIGVVAMTSVYSIVNDVTAGQSAGDLEAAQKANMEWRTEREDGNKFAKYAGAAVFAPLIFTIPFPTMTYTFQNQEMLMQVAGGNYVKNVLSVFVILVFLGMLKSGSWREHVLPVSFVLGYLAVLVLSQYAQSGRFHMPVLPFEMMFAAYAVSQLKSGTVRWFNIALILEFLACAVWNWFKLAGRGMV